MNILIINGPNLNLLGKREPGVYGTDSLDAIEQEIAREAKILGADVDFFQSNHEGAIIDALHAAMDNVDGVVLNAGAYTHYSYAIRDAIAAYLGDCPRVQRKHCRIRQKQLYIGAQSSLRYCFGGKEVGIPIKKQKNKLK